jgi:hypothetical protein
VTYHHNHKLEGCEWCDDRHSLWGAFFLGLGVLAVGVILILDNFGVLDGSVIAPYWPLFLVAVGVSRLIRATSVRKIGCGLSWIAVGAVILAINLGLMAVGVGELWPLVLLIVGAHLLLRGARRHEHGEGGDTEHGSGATW